MEWTDIRLTVAKADADNAEGENHDERKEKTYDFLHFSTTLSVFNNF